MKTRKKECSLFCTVLLAIALCLLVVPTAHAAFSQVAQFTVFANGSSTAASLSLQTIGITGMEYKIGNNTWQDITLLQFPYTGSITVTDIGSIGMQVYLRIVGEESLLPTYSFSGPVSSNSSSYHSLSIVWGLPSQFSLAIATADENASVAPAQNASSNVPIPGAAFLFAPALLGLVGLRRRFSK